MNQFIVERDNDKNLRFSGEKLGEVRSSPDNSSSNYSRSTGRWTELTLYKTQSGKYVCEKIENTQWQGESIRASGAVCETEAEIFEFFGMGWLAKELYTDVGFEPVEEIE